MTVDVLHGTAQQLLRLAEREGRDVTTLVEEALQTYIGAAAITDLDADEIGAVQMALLPELEEIPEWTGGGE